MTGQTRPLLAALNEDYPKIKTYNTKEQVNGVVNYLITFLNIKVQGDEERKKLDQQMVLIYDLIRRNFGSLTFEEIKEAMRMYVSKEFPEIKVFRLLDCVSIGEILSAYVDYRNESLRVYLDKKQKLLYAPPDMSPEEKDQIVKDGINRKFYEFKTTKVIDDPCEYVFDFLVENGLIKLGNENTPKLQTYYSEKLKQAKKIVFSQHSKLSSERKSQRDDLKKELESIRQGKSPKITTMAKKLVLHDFFLNKLNANAETIF